MDDREEAKVEMEILVYEETLPHEGGGDRDSVMVKHVALGVGEA